MMTSPTSHGRLFSRYSAHPRHSPGDIGRCVAPSGPISNWRSVSMASTTEPLALAKGGGEVRRLVFLLPALILVALIVVLPAAETIRWSLWSWDGLEMTEFSGLSNYVELFRDESFINLNRFPGQIPPWGALIHNVLWVIIFNKLYLHA